MSAQGAWGLAAAVSGRVPAGARGGMEKGSVARDGDGVSEAGRQGSEGRPHQAWVRAGAPGARERKERVGVVGSGLRLTADAFPCPPFPVPGLLPVLLVYLPIL